MQILTSKHYLNDAENSLSGPIGLINYNNNNILKRTEVLHKYLRGSELSLNMRDFMKNLTNS